MAVVPQKHEVNVTFFRNGKLETVAAKGAIMATPKFITARIVENLPEKQRAAIRNSAGALIHVLAVDVSDVA